MGLTKNELKKFFESLDKINNSINKISRKQSKNNFPLIISLIAVLISFMSLAVIAIPSSPKVFFYGDLKSEDSYCLPILSYYGRPFDIGFTNTGSKPTRLVLVIEGRNIELKQGTSISSGEEFPYKNGIRFETNLLPYTSQNGLTNNYAIKITNKSLDTASLKISYSYKRDLFDIVPFIHLSKPYVISNCDYVLDPSDSENKWILQRT